jgi:uncharacterized protein (TIRG00374 family)
MRLLKRNIKYVLTCTLVGLFVWYFLANRESFAPILEINVPLLMFVAISNVLLMGGNGLFLKYIVEPFHKNLSYRESLYVSVLSSIGNFFAPAGGGLGFRAVYLKKKHQLSYTDYLSTLSGNYVIVFFCISLIGLIALAATGSFSSGQALVIAGFLVAIFLGSILATILRPIKPDFIEKIKPSIVQSFVRQINRVANGWDIIKKDRALLFKLLLVTLGNFVITVSITKLIAISLSIQVGFWGLILMSVVGSLSFIVNITPANLGVKEALYVFSATTIGLSTPEVLSIALIDRGVLFFVMVIMWAVTSRLRKNELKGIVDDK